MCVCVFPFIFITSSHLGIGLYEVRELSHQQNDSKRDGQREGVNLEVAFHLDGLFLYSSICLFHSITHSRFSACVCGRDEKEGSQGLACSYLLAKELRGN